MLRYAVIQQAGRWRIISAEEGVGSFATRQMALSAGARLAEEAQSSGQDVEILVQDAVGRLTALSLDPPSEVGAPGAAILKFPGPLRI